jgi:phage baseplate assembly protein W
MSIELLVPFSLDSNGHPAVTQDPDIQAMQHVKSIVATQPGTRVMLPTYGVPVRSFMFKPDPQLVTLKITRDVEQQMAAWEPSINVLSVRASPDSDFGVAEIDVDFSASPLQKGQVQTATVLVGGTVINSTQPVTGT